MAASIAGFVLRAGDRHETSRFYEELGLRGNEHQHGGPVHYAMGPMSDECVMEVYSRSPAFSQDALMLNVDSIVASLQVAATFGIQAKMNVREMQDALFIYITDPDGRPVMLIEKKQKNLGVRS